MASPARWPTSERWREPGDRRRRPDRCPPGECRVRRGRGLGRGAGERISAVGEHAPPAETASIDVGGLLLMPGLVDVHQHGGGGGSYDGGPAAATEAVRYHRRHGTTTSMASLVSAPLDVLEEQVRALVPLVEDGTLAGLHLEGPWLNPARAGAHAPAALVTPRPDGRRPAAGRRTGQHPHGHARAPSCRVGWTPSTSSPPRVWSWPSGTPTPITPPPARRCGGVPVPAPTCSTRCGRCTTASPGPCRRCSSRRRP